MGAEGIREPMGIGWLGEFLDPTAPVTTQDVRAARQSNIRETCQDTPRAGQAARKQSMRGLQKKWSVNDSGGNSQAHR